MFLQLQLNQNPSLDPCWCCSQMDSLHLVKVKGKFKVHDSQKTFVEV